MTEPVRQTWGAPPRKVEPLVHSWSSIDTYQQCPWRFYWKHAAPKEQCIREAQSVQMTDGNQTHHALEVAVRDGIPLAEKYAKHQPMVDSIRAASGMKIVEWQFGITKNWHACGFFEKDVWIRGKIDAGVIGTTGAALFDYKTGKKKEESMQLALFAAAAWAKFPMLKVVRTSFIWLPEPPESMMTPAIYKDTDLPEIKEHFSFVIRRIEDSNQRDHWPKIPSGLCSWCPVGADKCEYWRAYKGVPK